METIKVGVLFQLGKRIAFLRKQRRMSQLTLSIESGVAKSYLSDLERGGRNPSVLILNKIALGLNVTLEEMFQGIIPLEGLLKNEERE